MPSLGPAEILVVLVVALLVFGPNKMPEIGRQLARGVREFRRVQEHLTSELHSVVADLDPTAPNRPGSGGDPVPTLPPKERTDSPAAPNAAPEADELNPSPQAEASGSTGEPPSSPPPEPA
jgi:sec-independent protein translocase protein TatA